MMHRCWYPPSSVRNAVDYIPTEPMFKTAVYEAVPFIMVSSFGMAECLQREVDREGEVLLLQRREKLLPVM